MDSVKATKHPIKVISITSQIKEMITGKISFSGYVLSCRNLGSVIFVLLQDQFGCIQGVLQNRNIERKAVNFLVGKKVYIIGTIKNREHVATSSGVTNGLFEIEIEQCYLVNIKNKLVHFPVNQEITTEIYSIKHEAYDSTLFLSRLISRIRSFLAIQFFSEVDSHLLFGFDRYFYFEKNSDDVKKCVQGVAIGANWVAFREMLTLVQVLINDILFFNALPQLDEFQMISEEKSQALFGSTLPDFRFIFQIVDLTDWMKKSTIALFPLKSICALAVPELASPLTCINKIITYVRNKTGVNLTYLIKDGSGEIHGPFALLFPADLITGLLGLIGVKKPSIVLFSIHLDRMVAESALGLVFDYLKNENLYHLDGVKAGWVTQAFVEKATLAINGVQIGVCSLQENQGFIKIDLLGLTQILQGSPNKKNAGHMELKKNKLFIDEDISNEVDKIKIAEKNEIQSFLRSKYTKLDYINEFNFSVISEALSFYAMKVADGKFILNLLPEKARTVYSLPVDEIFQFLWSILGHKHVLNFIEEWGARLTIKKLCEFGIITDYRQILFFQKSMLLKIKNEFKVDNSRVRKALKAILCGAPNEFSNFINYYSQLVKKPMDSNENVHLSFLKAAKYGLTTPLFHDFFSRNHENQVLINEFKCCIQSLYPYILTYRRIDRDRVVSLFGDMLKKFKISSYGKKNDQFYEILYYFFRPLNMDLETLKSYYSQISDKTHHLERLGLHFKGSNWNEVEMCYMYEGMSSNGRKLFLNLFPSKNAASFFSKASAGICTAVDVNLFEREDHFHFNLVDPTDMRVIGNVQLYVFDNDDKQTLLIRGINPSANYLTHENVIFILQAVLSSAVQIAENSSIDDVLLCPSLGIWHVESSRIEMIAALSLYCKKLPTMVLKNPFFLFYFANQAKCIDFGYQVWTRVVRIPIGTNACSGMTSER